MLGLDKDIRQRFGMFQMKKKRPSYTMYINKKHLPQQQTERRLEAGDV